MECKEVKNTLPFKRFDLYNTTAYVQNHTLINRGIVTLGGSTVPQCIMSNNKYEAQERAIMGGVYLAASYLTPLMLLPLYNKHFLKNKGITKSLEGVGKKIIQMPKKYLKPDADLKQGLDETAKLFDKKGGTEHKKAFDEIYARYENPEKLKKDLLDVHEKVLTTDFMTTAAMWSAIPWIATETTEKRTNRKDFSAGFNLKNDSDKKQNKSLKLALNALCCVVPALLFSKTVTKGLSKNFAKAEKSEGLLNKVGNKVLKKISDNPDRFEYTSGTNMSKTIYASIWALSSFPAKIISSRDENERKDRALRDAGLFAMFFGGDYLLNNVMGRAADKFLGTKIMEEKGENLNFVQKFKLGIKNFNALENEKGLSAECLKKTKNVGAGLYWTSLLANTALIGFALPKALNKFLRRNIDKENNAELPQASKKDALDYGEMLYKKSFNN